MTKVQATKALKGGALEELEEEDDEGPQPVLEMDFSVVDMGMHFVEVDQTPLEEDQVLGLLRFMCRGLVRWPRSDLIGSAASRPFCAVVTWCAFRQRPA